MCPGPILLLRVVPAGQPWCTAQLPTFQRRLGYSDHIGIMEKWKLQELNIGVLSGLYGDIGIMEKNMEASMKGLGKRADIENGQRPTTASYALLRRPWISATANQYKAQVSLAFFLELVLRAMFCCVCKPRLPW